MAKLSAIKIPKGIQNDGHADSVRWTAFKADGTEAGKWDYIPCYSSIMRQLGEYEIHCRPYWNRPPNPNAYSNRPSTKEWIAKDAKVRDATPCLLPGDLYTEFWKLCKESGLAPKATRNFARKGQNRLVIPRKGWDRHTVYTALSLYRHCDCHPKLIATAVLLYEKLKSEGVHFLQCLQYAMAEYNSPNTGHVFITTNHNGGYDSNYGGLNIATGMAMAFFSQMDIRKRKKLEPENSTVMMFCQLAMRWNPIKVAGPKRSYSSVPQTGSGKPEYRLENKESLLLPEFATFYENPAKVTPEEFAEAMKKECEK